MRNYKEIKEAIKGEAELITPRLQKLTYDLIKIVESDQIESFGFRSNKEDITDNKSIRVNITVKSDPNNVILGLFDDLKEFPKAEIIFSEKTFIKLNEINSYLAFVNEHLKKDLPEISESSYYSINAVNRLGGFKAEPVKNLLPKFMKEELAPMKAARPK